MEKQLTYIQIESDFQHGKTHDEFIGNLLDDLKAACDGARIPVHPLITGPHPLYFKGKGKTEKELMGRQFCVKLISPGEEVENAKTETNEA